MPGVRPGAGRLRRDEDGAEADLRHGHHHDPHRLRQEPGGGDQGRRGCDPGHGRRARPGGPHQHGLRHQPRQRTERRRLGPGGQDALLRHDGLFTERRSAGSVHLPACHVRLSIHTLIESLMRYNQPIIASDLEGWQAVELIIKSGVSIVSCEAISPSNDMLLPVEKKKLTKLHSMYENFR